MKVKFASGVEEPLNVWKNALALIERHRPTPETSRFRMVQRDMSNHGLSSPLMQDDVQASSPTSNSRLSPRSRQRSEH